MPISGLGSATGHYRYDYVTSIIAPMAGYMAADRLTDMVAAEHPFTTGVTFAALADASLASPPSARSTTAARVRWPFPLRP